VSAFSRTHASTGDTGVGVATVSEVVDRLCSVAVDRRPGSRGNAEAVDYVAGRFAAAGWAVSLPEFACLDWKGGDATVRIGSELISLTPSPYGIGVTTSGPIRVVNTAAELDREDLAGSVLVVAGELVSEPMTPKAFPFYASAQHSAVIHSVETSRPEAVIAVTGKHPELCGALEPFPWIEDGDFEIPVAAVRPEDAGSLLDSDSATAHVTIDAVRIRSTARNIIARRGPEGRRLTVCAHIDTKPGTPGAVDNATGIAALVHLAERLGNGASLPVGVELLCVNGEDHFAAPGEVAWLADNESSLDDIELFVNIDGAGYHHGRTAFSFYNVEEPSAQTIRAQFAPFADLIEGPAWYQSDHAILAMRGRPALAFTTEHVARMLEELFHSEHDTVDKVAPERVVSMVAGLEVVVLNWGSAVAPPGSVR
jgi:aminopeptidase YwaD